MDSLICSHQWLAQICNRFCVHYSGSRLAFSNVVKPLQTFLEKVYNRPGKHTARAVTRVNLSYKRSSYTEDTVLAADKTALEHLVTLSHQNER